MTTARGITRTVVLTKRHAIKLPSFRSWKLFLTGLLANMHEAFWWDATRHDSRLCPVTFAFPGGWFIVMRRCEPLGDEFDVDYDGFDGLPLDPKPTNFGWLEGRLVMLDYGS